MIVLAYDPMYGDAVADGRVNVVVLNLLLLKNYHGTYSTENIFNAFRLLVARGDLAHTEVEFYYKGERFQLNKYGNIVDVPAGFCDYNIELSAQILTAAMNKRKERVNGTITT